MHISFLIDIYEHSIYTFIHTYKFQQAFRYVCTYRGVCVYSQSHLLLMSRIQITRVTNVSYVHIMLYIFVLKLQVSFCKIATKKCEIYKSCHRCTANPTWGDIFESSFKAQSSKLERLFSLKNGKRDVRVLSFELSKMSPQVLLAVHTP